MPMTFDTRAYPVLNRTMVILARFLSRPGFALKFTEFIQIGFKRPLCSINPYYMDDYIRIGVIAVKMFTVPFYGTTNILYMINNQQDTKK